MAKSISGTTSKAKLQDSPPAAKPRIVSQDDVRAKAYSLWQKRGRQNGDDLSDWFSAERELN